MRTAILFSFFLFPFFLFGQVQIGNDILGKAETEEVGNSVALSADGNRVAVGAPGETLTGPAGGRVRIYQLENDEWIQIGNDIIGLEAGDKFGRSVAISADGNRVAVGIPFYSGDNGLVKVYEFNGTDWEPLGNDISDSSPFGTNRWGESLSISGDGNRLIVGAPWSTGGPIGSFAGYSEVFEFNGTTWEPLGSGIFGENENDFSGLSVSISSDGNRIAIGDSRYDDLFDDVGKVRVFEHDGMEWQKVGSDIMSDNEQSQFGFVVSLSSDGNRVAASAPFNDDFGTNTGQTKIFEFNGTDWEQLGNGINGIIDNEFSGWSMAMSPSGDRVAIGASVSTEGKYRFFEFNGDSWEFLGQVGSVELGVPLGSGLSFSADGSRVATGVPSESISFIAAGLVRVYGELIFTNTFENKETKELNIFPNPTDGILYISNNSVENTIQIIDNNGNTILDSINESKIDISFLPDGVYFILLNNGSEYNFKKLIKK